MRSHSRAPKSFVVSISGERHDLNAAEWPVIVKRTLWDERKEVQQDRWTLTVRAKHFGSEQPADEHWLVEGCYGGLSTTTFVNDDVPADDVPAAIHRVVEIIGAPEEFAAEVIKAVEAKVFGQGVVEAQR